MKTEILISIIIPAYNEEKLIGLCLSSLQNQNFNKRYYEIIVINNASTDNTAQIVQNFEVRLIDEPKKGVTFAIKRGFMEAKGKIIAITEADTLVPPDWLSKIYKAFQKNSDVKLTLITKLSYFLEQKKKEEPYSYGTIR
jgi:glycosyltransferase involved in cell wall biosynthesis